MLKYSLVMLALVAVAGCTAVDVISILQKKRQDVTDYLVEITGTRAEEYPRKFTGHLRALLKDGTQKEYRQPYIRGGVEEPLSDSELESKFMENARYGGWTSEIAHRLLAVSRTVFAQPTLEGLQEFRG